MKNNLIIKYKMTVSVKFLSALIFVLPLAVSEADYTYDNPLEWMLQYPTCVGNMQSPISLEAEEAIPLSAPLTFQNYNTRIVHPVEATNNGHTVLIPITKTIDGLIPSITGGGLDSVYQVQDIRFHWGASSIKPGSEHSINGKRYNFELQILHKNIKYPTLAEAGSHSDGLAVFGVLFNVIESVYSNNTSLNSIFEVLPSLITSGSKKVLTGSVIMRYFLNDLKLRHFFRYQGSLTTPPCSEAVTWFVFADPVPIAMANLKRFWALNDHRGEPLLNNYRPLQPSENRVVYLNQP